MKTAILANEIRDDHADWILALKDSKINFDVIDLTSKNWFDRVLEKPYDIYFLKPGGYTNKFKTLYDERVYILSKILSKNVYPSYQEIKIYENKRMLSYFLAAHNIPHPVTKIIYLKNEAYSISDDMDFPLVAKTNIGASGRGVRILKTTHEYNNYVNRLFTKGVSSSWGPTSIFTNPVKRLQKVLSNKGQLSQKIKKYSSISKDLQTYLIIQEFIPHSYEWRVVRIGESYFAHKKVVKQNKASGSLEKIYDNPPLELFDFVRDITIKANLNSVAVDIFEYPKGSFLINEIQCIFGQSDAFQMKVNNKIGRYIFSEDNRWCFEEGDFNINRSYNLRVTHALQKFKKHI